MKLVLPALTEATSPLFRPIKYSLFPPLGLDDAPELVVIQVYITSASRAYAIADHYRERGAYVALGGLHVTSLPDEAAAHADTIFLGPGEDTWPAFLADFRAGRPAPRYRSTVRTLEGLPRIRRDLIKRHLYLVPNSIVVSRGCPHTCDFCYKEAFFESGKGFYTQTVDDALAEIERLPGRHLYFLDDHLFGSARFATALFDGMRGMRGVWQAAGTVASVLRPGLLERAVDAGLRSLFVGFETLSADNLREQGKLQNLHARMRREGRVLHDDWNRYDTRHAVYRPARITPEELEAGYRHAYESFYRWGSILRGAASKPSWTGRLRHVAYAAGWKKFEPLWDFVIRAKRVSAMLPLLETVLDPSSNNERLITTQCGAASTCTRVVPTSCRVNRRVPSHQDLRSTSAIPRGHSANPPCKLRPRGAANIGPA